MLITNCRGKMEVEIVCGRFVLLDDEEIAEINNIVREVGMKYDGRGLSMKTGEVFPTNNAPVLAMQSGKPSLSLMKWGFPKWEGKGVIINAKSETAAEKKMFATAFAARRCIIPTTGFFEWAKTEGNAKQKFQFNVPDSPMLYLAGLYTDFQKQEKDEPLTERFVILTCAANEDVSDIHNRMPVIIYREEIKRWLTDFGFAETIVKRDSVRLIRAVA